MEGMEGMIYDLRSVAHLRSCDVCDTRLSVICDLLRAGWLSGADPGTIDDREKKKTVTDIGRPSILYSAPSYLGLTSQIWRSARRMFR